MLAAELQLADVPPDQPWQTALTFADVVVIADGHDDDDV
jgi:hypothetical protein